MSKIFNILNCNTSSAINTDDCPANTEKNHEPTDVDSPFIWKQNTVTQVNIGNEVVDHPSHYAGKNGIEAIDVIDAYDLNFNMGSALKYILRCGKKDDEIIELEKAIWYLKHEVELRKQEKERMQN